MTELTLAQIGIWMVSAGAIRGVLPPWIRTHNDELRDRRRVAREARERAEALDVASKKEGKRL